MLLEALTMEFISDNETREKELQHVSDPEQRSSLFSQANPDVINLAVAENVLIFDRFKKIFQDSTSFTLANTKYPQFFYGEVSVRQMTANLLSKTFEHKVEPAHLSGVSGVSAALENLAFALFSPGDTVLVPTPYWQGFKWCFQQRPRMTIIPVDLLPQDGFKLTVSDVKKAYDDADPNNKPKAVVLTNPHNPLGINYERELLEELYTWVLTKTKMHIISDEMYCHSQIDKPGPDFVSAFALNVYKRNKDRVHIVWGFAKDFGLSGFKAGFIVSTCEKVHNHVRSNISVDIPDRYGWFSPFDSLKNFMLQNILSADNGDLPHEAMQEYKKKLTIAFKKIEQLFNECKDIKLHPPTRAAQFFWLDLRAYLDRVPSNYKFSSLKASDLLDHPECAETEDRLLKYIANQGKVQLLPGQTLSCKEPGFFRLCFTCEETHIVEEAVKRMIKALEALPKP
jgi:aspartate/methionine/tyrosine aminotransferase